MSDKLGWGGGKAMDGAQRTERDGGTAAPDGRQARTAEDGAGGSERAPVPPWLNEGAGDFGAPQAVIDALVARLGFQPMARLIADRPAFRAAVITEYRRQCARLRVRLLYEEWHP